MTQPLIGIFLIISIILGAFLFAKDEYNYGNRGIGTYIIGATFGFVSGVFFLFVFNLIFLLLTGGLK